MMYRQYEVAIAKLKKSMDKLHHDEFSRLTKEIEQDKRKVWNIGILFGTDGINKETVKSNLKNTL